MQFYGLGRGLGDINCVDSTGQSCTASSMCSYTFDSSGNATGCIDSTGQSCTASSKCSYSTGAGTSAPGTSSSSLSAWQIAMILGGAALASFFLFGHGSAEQGDMMRGLSGKRPKYKPRGYTATKAWALAMKPGGSRSIVDLDEGGYGVPVRRGKMAPPSKRHPIEARIPSGTVRLLPAGYGYWRIVKPNRR